MVGTILGIMGSAAASIINNRLAGQQAEKDRASNYGYNELAAQNADARTRALYNDFYSPEALLKQYKKAGLSPSLMFGGTPGQGGMSGAQGNGANGLQTPYMPMSMLEAAQVANMEAQNKQIKAQTENINADTELKKAQTSNELTDNEIKQYQKEYNRLFTYKYSVETQIGSSMYVEHNGQKLSFFQIAQECKDYGEYLAIITSAPWTDEEQDIIHSELGQKTLREVWKTARTINDEIRIVSGTATRTKNEAEESEYNAAIQKANMNIMQALINSGFASMNAQAQIAQLRQVIQESELNEQIKGAWNRIIGSMKDGTTKDIMIILAMIFGQTMSKMTPSVGISIKK